jgi:hypothetical protein
MKTVFNAYISAQGGVIGEVVLFRALAHALSQKYKTLYLEETHQRYVEFNSIAISAPIQREISDIWIISFSRKTNEARMTFLQAKFDKKPKTSRIFKFSGEYFQYELLSDRPLIKDVSTNTNLFPDDVLSYTTFDSVGTFGVFYYDSNGDFDLAYCIASFLQCTSKAKIKKQTTKILKFPPFSCLHYPCFRYINELICTTDMDTFEFYLTSMLIGAPIHQNLKVIIMLQRIFATISDPIASNFIQLLHRLAPDLTNGTSADSENLQNAPFLQLFTPRILLIDVDGIAQ